MHMSVEESIQVRLPKLVSISVLLNESPRDFRKADLLITLIT